MFAVSLHKLMYRTFRFKLDAITIVMSGDLLASALRLWKKQFWVMCLIEISSYNHAIDTEIILKQNNNVVRQLSSLTVELSCWITGLNWPRDIDFHMFAFIFFIMFLPTYINSNSFYCSFWYFHLRHYLI